MTPNLNRSTSCLGKHVVRISPESPNMSPITRGPRAGPGGPHGVAKHRAVPAAASRLEVLLARGCCCGTGIGEAEAGREGGKSNSKKSKVLNSGRYTV